MGLKPRKLADGAYWSALSLSTSEAQPVGWPCLVCVFVFSPKLELSGVGQVKVKVGKRKEKVSHFREVNIATFVVCQVRVKVEVSQTG